MTIAVLNSVMSGLQLEEEPAGNIENQLSTGLAISNCKNGFTVGKKITAPSVVERCNPKSLNVICTTKEAGEIGQVIIVPM